MAFKTVLQIRDSTHICDCQACHIQIILFFSFCIISLLFNSTPMEGGSKNQNLKKTRKPRKKLKQNEKPAENQLKKQIIDDHPSSSISENDDKSIAWSQEIIEPAIKSMTFRPKRGTRMKQLMKGKYRNDQFWEKYQGYFGGNLDKSEESEDQEDYQASSSGRDQFDSDFDLTDSYAGKRGRKKGTKVRRRRKPITKDQGKPEGERPPRGRPGRKKKVAQKIDAPQYSMHEQKKCQIQQELSKYLVDAIPPEIKPDL